MMAPSRVGRTPYCRPGPLADAPRHNFPSKSQPPSAEHRKSGLGLEVVQPLFQVRRSVQGVVLDQPYVVSSVEQAIAHPSCDSTCWPEIFVHREHYGTGKPLASMLGCVVGGGVVDDEDTIRRTGLCNDASERINQDVVPVVGDDDCTYARRGPPNQIVLECRRLDSQRCDKFSRHGSTSTSF